jgi:hypothetical protein
MNINTDISFKMPFLFLKQNYIQIIDTAHISCSDNWQILIINVASTLLYETILYSDLDKKHNLCSHDMMQQIC